MLRPRIIPCLLLQGERLVKTISFAEPRYVGDPINAVRIFNEKQVDELMVIDIDATVKNKSPNFALIEKLAAQSRMPLTYGGGIRSVEHAKRIIELGIEKVAMSSAAIESPDLVEKLAASVGTQSVVVVLDCQRRAASNYEVVICRGTKNTGASPAKLARDFELTGAGEIVLNSVQNDGRMEGYDLELVEQVRAVTKIPITVLGGAGSTQHIGELFDRFGIVGAAAGSLFVFKGVYRAVLLNYPNEKERSDLFEKILNTK